MRDLSVVIPARNEHPQVQFTLQVIWDQLDGSGLDWETILVDNMSEDKTGTFCEKRYWANQGRHRTIRYDGEGSCWQARNVGIKAAAGRIIFLFDAHVVVGHGLFKKQLELLHDRPAAAICYTPVAYLGDTKKGRAYGYSLGAPLDEFPYAHHIKTKFWGSWTRQKRSLEPYPIPMSGTAGVAIRRSYLRGLPNGGWPEGLSVYGGGEQYMSFLAWMMGHEVLIHPDTYLYHFADNRKYSGNGKKKGEGGKSTNDANHFNKCLTAYALGGSKWWEHVLDLAISGPHPWNKAYHKGARDLADEARASAEPYRKWIEENALFTLDEVLALQPWMTAEVTA